MIEWKNCTIADLGTVVGGATPSTKDDDNYGGSISWITPKDLSNFQGRYISKGERSITNKGLKSCSTQLLPKHSVLFSSRAPIGYVAIAENELCTNQGFKSVVPNSNTDYLFLYYLLKYNKDKIEHLGGGTTFKEVSGSTMRDVKVRVPINISAQKAIASILDSIDSQIEHNKQINDNLLQQMMSLFKHYFINNPLSDTWQRGTFSDIIQTTIGGDWGKDSLFGNYTEEVFCIRGADIPDVKVGDKGKMPIRFILPKNYASKKLQANDLVVEISGGSPTQSTGRIAFISQSLLNRYHNKIVCTNFCRAVKPKSGYALFLYIYWQYLYDIGLHFTYENGTTGIKNFDLSGFITTEEILLPPEDLLSHFTSICSEYLDKINANGAENEKLSSIRDSMLPKLMSGEIDVSSIELD